MDNHPIPQDVTGFQFRLIGNMTIKQFAYLAAGCAIAFIIYYLPLFILIKALFIPLSAGVGFALAFMPIEGRPLDAMLGYYLRALTSPNQYIFQKSIGQFSFDRSFQQTPVIPLHVPVAVQKPTQPKETPADKRKKLASLLNQSPQKLSATDSKEEAFLSSVLSDTAAQPMPTSVILPSVSPAPLSQQPITTNTQLPNDQPIESTEENQATTPAIVSNPGIPTPPSISIPTPPIIIPTTGELANNQQANFQEERQLAEKEDELRKEQERLQQEREEAEKEQQAKAQEAALAEEKAKKILEENQMTHAKLLELEKSMQEMLSQKQTLEQELQKLKEQLAQKETPKTFTPSTAKEEPKQQTQLVRQIPQDQTQKKGLPPTPDAPNILLGLVKDSSGNILPNILIEVKDTEGNPVRAFKTNQLGQFASATPLANGTYTIEFEDPNGKNKFDAIELIAKGEILYPIEVISHDLRAELRKQLFT